MSWRAALRRCFYQGAEGLAQFKVWWCFCQVQVNTATVLSMNVCWAGYLQPTEVALVPSQCHISLWKSGNLFRSLIGLRVLILAIRPWKGWPEYKAMLILLLCLQCYLSRHRFPEQQWPPTDQVWSKVFMQLASVAKSNNALSFESLKCLLIYFAQCQFFSYSVGFFIILTLIQRICMACSFRQKESGIRVAYFG